MKSLITHTTSALIGVTTAALYFKLTSSSKESKTDENIPSKSTTTNTPQTKPYIIQSRHNNAPTLPVAIFNPNPNLEIAFDTRTKNPVYVFETITKQNLLNSSTRKGQRFTEEKDLLEYHRSRNGYYRKSGYDRGHLAPAANHPTNIDSTFTLCNVSPQVSSFNRGIWSSLEDLVRKVTLDDEVDITYVVTGPLWLPSQIINDTNSPLRYKFEFESIGTPPSIIHVPTHFFKVIIVTNKQGHVIKYASFVLPNNEMKEKQSLSNFIVRITDIEAVTGMDFSPLLQLFSKSFNDQYSIEEFKDLIDSMTYDVKNNKLKQITSGDKSKDVIPMSLPGVKKLSDKQLKELKKIVQHICDRPVDSSSKKQDQIYRC